MTLSIKISIVPIDVPLKLLQVLNISDASLCLLSINSFKNSNECGNLLHFTIERIYFKQFVFIQLQLF